MFKKNNKLLALAATAAIIVPISTASAVTENIDAVASFLTAITLANVVDMDFGTVEFSGAPTVLADQANLGTDGSMTYGGVFSGSPTGTAGSVDITSGTNTSTVDVFCDATATMARVGGGFIGLTSIEAAAENATGAFGAAGACNGVGGALATSLVLDVGVLDTFVFGGRIDGSTAVAFVAGDYSTAFAGGDDIEVRVFYQ